MERLRAGTMARSLIVIAALTVVSVSTATAQDLCIVGATVHTVVAEPSIQTVCVEGDRIVSIDDTAEPSATTVVDGTEMVLTPGLIEIVSEIGLVEIWAVSGSVDTNAGDEDSVRSGYEIVDAINPQSSLVPIARTGGVTSVVTTPSGGLIPGQSIWWDLGESHIGDLVAPESEMLWMRLGASGGGSEGGSRASALLRVREVLEDARAFIANPDAYDSGQMRDLSVSRVDLEALEPVLAGEMPVVIDVRRQSDILAALRLAEDYAFPPILYGAHEAWAVADELAEAQVPCIVDPMVNLPYNFDMVGARSDNAALLDEAGVPVIISTSDAHNVRLLRQYAGNAVRAGMDWASALAAVTLRPAQAVGVDADYGSIEVGKVANLVLWSGDPFELSTSVQQMWVRGQSVSLETRQDALYERYSD